MTTKHTPGPWQISEVDDDAGGRVFSVAQVEGAPYTPDFSDVCKMRMTSGEQYDIQMANARMIAAAPRLFEFAQEVRRSGDTRLASMAIAVIAEVYRGIV